MKAHLFRVLHGQMTEPADAGNGDPLAGPCGSASKYSANPPFLV
jgi:hypothetical protein